MASKKFDRVPRAPGDDRQFKGSRRIYKETEKWWTKLFRSMAKKDVSVPVIGVCAIAPLVYPQSLDFFMFFIILPYGLFCWLYNKDYVLGLRKPKFSKDKLDKNNILPGDKFGKPEGILFLGLDNDGYELWLKKEDMTTHMQIFGTTGSGKTVTLQSISYNSFVLGTGLCYIDPKGSPSLVHELFSMARRVSREDDFLVLNFMTGGKKSEGATPFRMSNTTNPFSDAPADAITNLLTSLLPKDDGGGNSVFQQKAQALLMALVPILAALRDAKQSLPITDMSQVKGLMREKGKLGSGLSIAVIRDFLEPTACVSLVYPLKNPQAREPGENEQITDEWEECYAVKRFVNAGLIDTFKAALTSLNFNPAGKPPSEQQTFLDQFGYAKGYFGAPLASISGMYGHLFNVSTGEVDLGDVLFNRRIMVGVLPSLEKSPQECENLGKIILASIKQAVSGGLGTRTEGDTKIVTKSLASASKVPGILVVDEYAAIMMPGFELIMTQARSLGFMGIIASQDYGGLKNKDAKSCEQIFENTKVKLFMKMTSAADTWEQARKLAGDVNVEEINLNEPEKRGQIKSVARIHQSDLMDQTEGQFHCFFESKIIRGRTLYLVPPAKKGDILRLNRLIRTDSAPEIVRKNIAAETAQWSKPEKIREEDEKWLKEIISSIRHPYAARLRFPDAA